MKLIRIVAPHFVAGLEADGEVVTKAAPILRYMIGWASRKVKDYCRKKDWKLEVVVQWAKKSTS